MTDEVRALVEKLLAGVKRHRGIDEWYELYAPDDDDTDTLCQTILAQAAEIERLRGVPP